MLVKMVFNSNESIVNMNKGTQEVLIKWIGFPDEINTWETEDEAESVEPKRLSDFRRRILAQIESDRRQQTPKL